MPGIEYEIGLESGKFGAGIQKSMLALGAMGVGIAVAGKMLGSVFSDISDGFASLDLTALKQIDPIMSEQIAKAKEWSDALNEGPIQALLKLAYGSTVREESAERDKQLALMAKQLADAMQRSLENGLKTADQLKAMATKIRGANQLMDEKAGADAAGRERSDAAEVRGGAAPEDVAARRSEFDAAAKRARLDRELDAKGQLTQSAADNKRGAALNQVGLSQNPNATPADLEKAVKFTAEKSKQFDLSMNEYNLASKIHTERIRGIREELLGRKESLESEKAERLAKEALKNAPKLKQERQRPEVSGGTRPSADRLAQIGGYVGGAANGLANRVAERTAKGVEDTVKGLDKLLAYSMRSTGAFPEAVF